MAERTVTEAITDAAISPAKIEVDGMVVTEHSIPDKIAADSYLRREAARTSTGLPIRCGVIRPRGTV